MEPNIKVARAHRALSWLYGAMTLLFTFALLWRPENKDVNVPVVMIVIGIFFGGLFLLHHFTAKGAREKKAWARITSCIIAVFMLPGFPIGTLIGIYLLINAGNSWEGAAARSGSAAGV